MSCNLPEIEMASVIPFERMKDVSGWSLDKIGAYVKENGWKGFVLHWDTDDEKVVIERTRE